MAKVNNLKIGQQTGNLTTAYATWEFSKKNVDCYRVYWYYYTDNKIWFNAGYSDVKVKQATYSIPSNATRIKVSVKPISTKYKSKGKEVSHWTGTYVSKVFYMSASKPQTPGAPSVELTDLKLKCILDIKNTTVDDYVQFQLERNGVKTISSKHIFIGETSDRATCTFDVYAGYTYRVKCRVINYKQNSSGKFVAHSYSDWSPFSNEISTKPGYTTNTIARASSESSVTLTWNAGRAAKSYEIEYTDKKEYFDSNPSGVQTATSNTNHAEITGLESGKHWFFRVRSVNDSGQSEWRPVIDRIVGVKLGIKPEPPTTWTFSTNASVGDDVTLYWTHNSADSSRLTNAKIELKVGSNTTTLDYLEELSKLGLTKPTSKDYEAEPTYSLPISTSNWKDGDEILWRVQTKGILNDYSDWSVQRSIKLHETPKLTIDFGGVEDGIDGVENLTSFPHTIKIEAGPESQTALNYFVCVKAKDSYTTEDSIGREHYVAEGTELYSYIDVASSNSLDIVLKPDNINLENNQRYTVKANVTMSSGLSAEAEVDFDVDWNDYQYEPEASIDIDPITLTATIAPVCYKPDNADALAENVELSVYRINYDGTFTEIETGIANNGKSDVIDIHPALDYARYRIVATDLSTGSVSYEDWPGEPVGETSIVIQWDEEWSTSDYAERNEEYDLEDPPFTYQMIKLPYDVKVSEQHDPDVSLIKYLGREHPVSYYGTHRGETASWSTVIDKNDTDTIYALRRLAIWTGDVYVREPSGVGYWAHVVPSFSIDRKQTTIPVTFDIVRVEGGK